jgi:hypothetical protein
MRTKSVSYAALWIILVLVGGVMLFVSQLWPAIVCFSMALVLFLLRWFIIRRVERSYPSPEDKK